MGILNIGTRALQANQIALETAGNNIANVNTKGYSRQSVVLQTVAGQFTGAGYIGKGVDVLTIQRNFSAFLTRQSTLAGSTQAADATRADNLKQLETIFSGGPSGLGAAISDMMNAFSDVASAPTDLTARTVVLTRVDETAARMRATSQSLDDLQQNVAQSLTQKAVAINDLAKNIAAVNNDISRTQGSGQSPNDLLDRRDQLVRDLNQYIQTSSINASDGTVGIFIGGSQALVLGSEASTVSIVTDDFGDPLKSKLAINRGGQIITLDDSSLAGGEVTGLMRFVNNDMAEGRNLLGRLTLAVSTAMNNQHQLGLDLDGNVGGNIFSPITFGSQNIFQPSSPARVNSGDATLSLAVKDPGRFAASDYEVTFSSATSGTIIRRSDGTVTNFPQSPAPAAPIFATVDGLDFSNPTGTANPGDRFLVKPFSSAANNITSVFSTPRSLAVASPVAGYMATKNTGSLQQVSLSARNNPPTAVPVTLTFTGPNSYTRSDELPTADTTVFAYTPGQAIEATYPDLPPTDPLTYSQPLQDWTVTLQGSPQAGDSYTVQANTYSKLNAGNATAMMALRDKALFDGSALTDGYASLISQIGIRAQSANYAADVSATIAANVEKDRTGVSGVNLDEEAAKLLQFQQAYQASAKMMQIAQSVFQTLMQQLGG